MCFQYDPWKQQIVLETNKGEMVIELMQSDREFYLFCLCQETVKGLYAINQRVSEMIANGEVTNLYIDTL